MRKSAISRNAVVRKQAISRNEVVVVVVVVAEDHHIEVVAVAVEVLAVAIQLVQHVALIFVELCAHKMPFLIPAFAIVEEAAEHSGEQMLAWLVETVMLLLPEKISSAVHIAS